MVDTPEEQVAIELAKLRKELKLQRKNQRTLLRSFTEGAAKKFIAGAFTMAKSVDKLAVDFYKVGVNISNATEKLGEQFRTSEIGFTMSMRQHSKNLAIGFKGVQRDIMNLTNMAQVTGQDAEGQRRALLKSMVVGGLSIDATNALARTMIKTSLDYGTATQLMADNLDNILSKHGPSIALSMASGQIQGAVAKLTGKFPGYEAAISTLVDVMISGETDALATRAIYDVQRLSQQLDMAQTEDEAYKILMNAVSVLGPTLLRHTDKFAGTTTAWVNRQRMAEALGNKNIALISNLWRAIERGEGKTKKVGMDRVGEFDYLLTFQATTEKLLDPMTELGTAAHRAYLELYSMSTWIGPALLGGLGALLNALPVAAAAYFGAKKAGGRGGVPRTPVGPNVRGPVGPPSRTSAAPRWRIPEHLRGPVGPTTQTAAEQAARQSRSAWRQQWQRGGRPEPKPKAPSGWWKVIKSFGKRVPIWGIAELLKQSEEDFRSIGPGDKSQRGAKADGGMGPPVATSTEINNIGPEAARVLVAAMTEGAKAAQQESTDRAGVTSGERPGISRLGIGATIRHGQGGLS